MTHVAYVHRPLQIRDGVRMAWQRHAHVTTQTYEDFVLGIHLLTRELVCQPNFTATQPSCSLHGPAVVSIHMLS